MPISFSDLGAIGEFVGSLAVLLSARKEFYNDEFRKFVDSVTPLEYKL